MIKQGVIPRASSCRMMLETIKKCTGLTDKQLADFLETSLEMITDNNLENMDNSNLIVKIKTFYLRVHLSSHH